MFSRKLALSLAKQYRTCPPQDIKDDPSHRKNVDHHLAICPYCATQEPDPAGGGWEELAEKLQDIFSSSPPAGEAGRLRSEHGKPAPGKFYFVRPELATWRSGYFYNPPMVLLLSAGGGTDAVSDDILVAQTYHDSSLAGPGDLILASEQTQWGELFVECWNTYTLRAANLGAYVGQVSPEIVAAVKKLGQDPGALPDWAMSPRPFTDHDARIYFRELEVEVGYTFASSAIEELMEDPPAGEAGMERPRLRLAYSSPQQLRDSIKEKAPGTRWARESITMEEALVLAQLPQEQLALAADETDRRTFPANLILLQDGRIKTFKPIRFEIFSEQLVSGGMETSGRVFELPENLSGSMLLCLFEVEGQRAVASTECEWDETTGSFFAEFKIEGDAEGKMALAVVCDLSGETHE